MRGYSVVISTCSISKASANSGSLAAAAKKSVQRRTKRMARAFRMVPAIPSPFGCPFLPYDHNIGDSETEADQARNECDYPAHRDHGDDDTNNSQNQCCNTHSTTSLFFRLSFFAPVTSGVLTKIYPLFSSHASGGQTFYGKIGLRITSPLPPLFPVSLLHRPTG